MAVSRNSYQTALDFLDEVRDGVFSSGDIGCFFRFYNEAKKEKIIPSEDNYNEHMAVIFNSVKNNRFQDRGAGEVFVLAVKAEGFSDTLLEYIAFHLSSSPQMKALSELDKQQIVSELISHYEKMGSPLLSIPTLQELTIRGVNLYVNGKKAEGAASLQNAANKGALMPQILLASIILSCGDIATDTFSKDFTEEEMLLRASFADFLFQPCSDRECEKLGFKEAIDLLKKLPEIFPPVFHKIYLKISNEDIVDRFIKMINLIHKNAMEAFILLQNLAEARNLNAQYILAFLIMKIYQKETKRTLKGTPDSYFAEDTSGRSGIAFQFLTSDLVCHAIKSNYPFQKNLGLALEVIKYCDQNNFQAGDITKSFAEAFMSAKAEKLSKKVLEEIKVLPTDNKSDAKRNKLLLQQALFYDPFSQEIKKVVKAKEKKKVTFSTGILTEKLKVEQAAAQNKQPEEVKQEAKNIVKYQPEMKPVEKVQSQELRLDIREEKVEKKSAPSLSSSSGKTLDSKLNISLLPEQPHVYLSSIALQNEKLKDPSLTAEQVHQCYEAKAILINQLVRTYYFTPDIPWVDVFCDGADTRRVLNNGENPKEYYKKALILDPSCEHAKRQLDVLELTSQNRKYTENLKIFAVRPRLTGEDVMHTRISQRRKSF